MGKRAWKVVRGRARSRTARGAWDGRSTGPDPQPARVPAPPSDARRSPTPALRGISKRGGPEA